MKKDIIKNKKEEKRKMLKMNRKVKPNNITPGRISNKI